MTRKALSNALATLGLVLALGATYGSALAQGQTLQVDITGMRSADGVVHVTLYDKAAALESYSVTAMATYKTVSAREEDVTVPFPRLTPGRYAIFVHHDEDADNSFDMAGQAALEGYGYSRNVGQIALPSFAEAAIDFEPGMRLSPIRMIYPD